MAFKMKGVPHYMQDGTEYKGDTHKMKDGTLHTGKTHNEDSEPLSHEKGKGFKMKTPLYKKVSWKYGDATYSGELIPSKETSTHRYARTHNNKIKSLPK